MELTAKESALIRVLRDLRFGRVEVVLHNGEPQAVVVKNERKVPLLVQKIVEIKTEIVPPPPWSIGT